MTWCKSSWILSPNSSAGRTGRCVEIPQIEGRRTLAQSESIRQPLSGRAQSDTSGEVWGMSAVALGLVLAKRLPRSPLLGAIREERRLRIVFEVYDLRALPAAGELERKPTIILADMEAGHGVRALMRSLRSRFPVVPVVMFDRRNDAMKAQRARNLGAAAVLTRRSGAPRFVA